MEPAMRKPLLLTGKHLSRREFDEVAHEGRCVRLGDTARRTMRRSRNLLERMIARRAVVYGVTTGVGSLSTEHIEPSEVRKLQLNILRSHACGLGEPLTAAETRGMLLLRAQSLASGLSGVRPKLAELLCEFLNRNLLPVVPSRGSVGASGDLAPLAHLALPVVGEGAAVLRGSRMAGGRALRLAGLRPIELHAKEGLALVNGTQAMLAVGLVALRLAEILVDSADVAGALSLDALRGSPVAFDERLQRARPHPGQQTSARNLVRLNRGSTIRESHRDCNRVQDAYSLRCMPQVHGAVRDALAHMQRVFEIEMNSSTDNPLIFPNGDVLAGGNFHGAPLATALDLAAIALTQLGAISERRTDRMVNPLTSGLPAFLARAPGRESGLMLAQVTAAALTAENRILAHPASLDSIPTSGNKEDFVSMGMTAALKLRPVVANVTRILAIELLAACQALDFLSPLRTGRRAAQAQAMVRKVSPPLGADRELHLDIARIAELVEQGAIAQALKN
jgi:histidine ammonia-lyase